MPNKGEGLHFNVVGSSHSVYYLTFLNTCRLLNVKDLVDRLHCNVCLLEYRGYGHSDGTPSEEGIYMDAQAAIDYLTKTYQRSNVIDPQKVGDNDCALC